MAKPTGHRGSWFADWKGESLPCVHECWCRTGRGSMAYLDPHVGDDPKWAPFIAAIESGGKVILTKDEIAADGQPTRRLAYIASYQVANVVRDGATLSFDFIKRLDDFT